MTAPTGRLLVVDDDPELLSALCDVLRAEGFEVAGFTDPAAALAALRTGGFDLLLSDLTMPGTDGIQLLRQALPIDPGLVGVIMTGQGSNHAAVEARTAGAFDFIHKPFRLRQLLPILQAALAARLAALASTDGQAGTGGRPRLNEATASEDSRDRAVAPPSDIVRLPAAPVPGPNGTH